MEAKQIKQLRADLGITQTDFGRLFGKQQRAIAFWEAGGRSPTKADVRALNVLRRYLNMREPAAS